MANSYYSNPMMGQSISRLISSVVPDPYKTSQAELAASQALLNNQTAQYRTAIGDTGMSGDLASMMIRALQAGPDYARVAPSIGNNALKFGAMGFNPSGNLTPDPSIASLILKGMRGGRGGSSGGSPTATPAAYDWSDLSATAQNRIAKLADNATFPEGVDPTAVAALIAQNAGDWATPEEAVAALQSEDVWHRPVIDMNEIGWDGQGFWANVVDAFTGPEVGPPEYRGAPTGTTADVPRPVTKEEYDALPKGTTYFHPDKGLQVKG